MLFGFGLLDPLQMLDDKVHDLVRLVCICMLVQETFQCCNLSCQLHVGLLRVSFTFLLIHTEIILLHAQEALLIGNFLRTSFIVRIEANHVVFNFRCQVRVQLLQDGVHLLLLLALAALAHRHVHVVEIRHGSDD